MSEIDLTAAVEAGQLAGVNAGCRCAMAMTVCLDCASEAAVRAAAPVIERAVRERQAARIEYLTDEVAFWKDQQKFAASAAATIADLDEEAPALRQMLRAEKERRRRAEDELSHTQPSPYRWLHSCNRPGNSVVASMTPKTCAACGSGDGTWSTFVTLPAGI